MEAIGTLQVTSNLDLEEAIRLHGAPPTDLRTIIMIDHSAPILRMLSTRKAAMNPAVQAIFGIVANSPEIYITSPWGYRTIGGVTRWHNGTDYGTNLRNLPMYAIADGIVVSSGWDNHGAGYFVWIRYKGLGNAQLLYCHMQTASVLRAGQTVRKGTLVGYTGTTGNSTGVHLHLGVKDKNGKYINPEEWGKLILVNATVGQPVDRDTAHPQLVVTVENLNVRSTPGLNTSILGYASKGYYYTDNAPSVEKDDYTWYNIFTGGWVAKINGVVLYPIEDTELEAAKQEIAALKTKIASAQKALA